MLNYSKSEIINKQKLNKNIIIKILEDIKEK